MKEWILDLCNTFEVVPVCPEQLGGLPTPRLPAEIHKGDGMDIWRAKTGDVIDLDDNIVTDEFLSGAIQTSKIARILGVKIAILKDRSPSCGVFNIFDGRFLNRLKNGMGVSAAALYCDGIKLFTETQDDIFWREFKS